MPLILTTMTEQPSLLRSSPSATLEIGTMAATMELTRIITKMLISESCA
jgi:hypothetical protein